MTTHPAFAAAHRLAPLPTTRDEATQTVWVRHYTALAMAAHTAFRDAIAVRSTGPRPELGYLMYIANSAAAAAVALIEVSGGAPHRIWDLTPELGSLNGECVDWLAHMLDLCGVNPADIEPLYNAGDFTSPSQPEPVPVTAEDQA